jgi:hypothetical protein
MFLVVCLLQEFWFVTGFISLILDLETSIYLWVLEHLDNLYASLVMYFLSFLVPIFTIMTKNTSIFYNIAIYLPTILLVILLFMFLLYSKENPIKSQ